MVTVMASQSKGHDFESWYEKNVLIFIPDSRSMQLE